MSKRAGIYTRISDDPEGLELGITRQQQDCRVRAERDGYEVVAVYPENDRGASTKSKKSRPLYAEMLEAIRAGELDVVIAYSNSRLTRRPRELEDLIQLHDQTGVRFLTVVSGDDNLSTADGRMVARIKASVDAAEAERIGERVSRAAKQRAEDGGDNGGGNRPYGWQAGDRTKLDPAEHAVLLEVADRMLAGEAVRAIARSLNDRGVPTATWRPPLIMKAWSVSALREMMKRPRLVGIRVYKGKRFRGNWEPALDDLTFRQLERLFEDASRRTSPSNVRKSLLAGLAVCGECGRPIASKTSSQKGAEPRRMYWCERCGLLRFSPPVNLYVERYVKQLLRQYQPVPDPTEDPKAIAEAGRLRAQIDAEIARYTDSDALTGDQLELILRGLNRRLQDAERRATPPRPRSKMLDGLTGEDPSVLWDVLDLHRRRAVIGLLVNVRILRAVRSPARFDPATVQIERR